jgi:flavorubredoxin
MKITDSVIYVGVNDHDIDLFEGQYVVPNGMAYNSYIVKGEKTAVMDSVDINFYSQWMANIKEALNGKAPDYIIVQHMEPDHSASINIFMQTYTETKIVASKQAFAMMKNFFGTDYPERQIIVGENDTLDLGGRVLTFVTASMVHWPEVIVTYDSKDKILFSADGFGKFGALDVEEDWACEARRYYFGIVGKYGTPVQNLLKKAANLEIEKICPLHGPILTENLGYYLDLYNTWSSYSVESEGVVIAYTSVYGNTKKAALKLAEILKEKGCPKVTVTDLARDDFAEAIEDAFRYGKLVLATTTYNSDVFPFMRSFVDGLRERQYQNRTIGIIENGSWFPTAAKIIKGMLEKSKNITYTDTTVTIKSAMNEENIKQLEALADELMK